MSIGVWQVLLILVIVLILFGAGKLPRVMGDLAKGIKNFKSGLKDEEEEAGKPVTAEQPAQQPAQQPADVASAPKKDRVTPG